MQRSTQSAALILLILAVLFPNASALWGQETGVEATTVPASESAPDQQQDDIENLRNDQREWWEIKETAAQLWKKGQRQDSMMALLSEPGLAPKVFTGLAVHFASVKERNVIGPILTAMAEREFGTLSETLDQHVLAAYHKQASVLNEVDSALVRYSATAAAPAGTGFARLCTLYSVLTDVVPESSPLTQDGTRYRAIEKLLFLWDNPANQNDPKALAAIRGQLVTLTGGFIDFESPAQWQDWFKSFRTETERDKVLPLQRIAKDAIAALKTRIDELAAQRRREVNDLISRMKTMGEPPTAFLLDADASVRKSALRVLRGMADELVPQQRLPAVQELTRLLERADLDDDRRRTLLDAAGALGKKLNQEERSNFAAAVFKGPDGLGPEVWRARLSAIAEIGVIDDPSRLDRLYDMANSPITGPKPAWIAVRGDILRACQTLKLDSKLLIRGLKDPDEEVRGVAASTLATAKGSWDEILAARLVDAAVAETGATALTRMLEALRNIGRERPELLTKDLLVAIMSIEVRASEANDARILGIVLHAGLARGDNDLPDLKLVQGLLSRVFSNALSPSDRAQLTEQILKSGSALGARLLAVILLEIPAALDHEQTDRAVAAILAQEPGVVAAALLLEMAGKLSGRADMPPALRAREAAILAATALARMRAGEEIPGVDLDEQVERLLAWRLASGDADLIAQARAELDAQVAAEPQSPRPLLQRAAFLMGLGLKLDDAGTELLLAAETDLRTALSLAGAMDEPAVTRINLDLACVLLLQGKFEDYALVRDRGNLNGSDRALLYQHVHGVLSSPGERALTILAGVGEEQIQKSPDSYSLLRLAARALSPRLEDQLALSDLVVDPQTEIEQELAQNCQILRDLDQAVNALVAGTAQPEALAQLDANPELAAALSAHQLLGLDDSQFDTRAELLLPKIAIWAPNAESELKWTLPIDDAQRSELRNRCERLALMEVEIQKRRARFLKRLALTLYSP